MTEVAAITTRNRSELVAHPDTFVSMDMPVTSRPLWKPIGAVVLAAATALGCGTAQASFLSGDALDTAANVLSWVVLALVPIIGIVVFWIVHVMPEKIAHRRHHPQTQAIQTLCLLSLVFGGLLWPIAWLWAYTKPVGYKLAYGTDKHPDYFDDAIEKARNGEMIEADLAHLRQELAEMQARGPLPPKLARLRDDIAVLEPNAAAVVREGA